MSTNCVFKTNELRRCIEHAKKCSKWRSGYTGNNPAVPGLLLVHDDGLYLMSNGNPGDTVPGEIGLYCAYAVGCDPDNDENYWDNSRALVGGSDFAELLPIKDTWLEGCDKFEEFHVAVFPEKILTRFAKPRVKTKKVGAT